MSKNQEKIEQLESECRRLHDQIHTLGEMLCQALDVCDRQHELLIAAGVDVTTGAVAKPTSRLILPAGARTA